MPRACLNSSGSMGPSCADWLAAWRSSANVVASDWNASTQASTTSLEYPAAASISRLARFQDGLGGAHARRRLRDDRLDTG